MEKKKISKPIIIIVIVAIILYLIPYAFVLWLIGGIAASNTSPSIPQINAATIDNSCKVYYRDIVSGYSSGQNSEGQYAPLFPEIGESTVKRHKFALSRTIRDALIYMGTEDTAEFLDEAVADTNGNIYWKDDPANPKRDISTLTLTTETTLGKLYGQQTDN